jgi:hypothetical protein
MKYDWMRDRNGLFERFAPLGELAAAVGALSETIESEEVSMVVKAPCNA